MRQKTTKPQNTSKKTKNKNKNERNHSETWSLETRTKKNKLNTITRGNKKYPNIYNTRYIYKKRYKKRPIYTKTQISKNYWHFTR